MIRVTDTIVFADRDVTERFVRASGSGGQNVNNDATAVELRVDLVRSSLLDVKERLIALAGRHMTAEGVLALVSRAYRSQAQNREAVRARLVALVKRAAQARRTRKRTTPGRAVREKRLVAKERHSTVKRLRAGRDDN
jgi:ribosome-associated protein